MRGSPRPAWWRRPIWRCGRTCSPPASWALSRSPRLCCRRCGRRAKGASCWYPARPGYAVNRPPRRTRRPRAPWSAGVSRWRSRSRRSDLGVTILVAGTYDTDIITDAGTIDDRNFDGPYARLHNTMNTRGRAAMNLARPPERFTDGLIKALNDHGSFRRRGVGPDASMLLVSSRILAGCRHAPRVADRAGHTQTRLDAGRSVAVDGDPEGDGVRRESASAAGVAALGVVGGEAPPKN